MQVDFKQKLASAERQLSTNDPHLAKVIAVAGPCALTPASNHYQTLVESIIGQQLSVKAASTITERFVQLFGGIFPMPQDILATSIDHLRSAGLSLAKARYIQSLAQHIMDGRLQINKLPELPNSHIIEELLEIKGVGQWTAHMFLIFSLGRLDVLPIGDLGIRTGVMKLYNLQSLPDRTILEYIAKTYSWHPFESVASWYIWRSLDNKPTAQAMPSRN